jgi:outer membrane receptor protein involved in Fe transport
MKQTRIAHVFLGALAACLLAVPGIAQDATGRIVGTVTDAQGAVVPRAKVTVRNTQTGQSRATLSDDSGAYQVIALQIGSYTVDVERDGFRKSMSSPQTLQINATLRVDIKLEVGLVSETVQVEATASGVEVENSTLGSSVTGNQIITAPLNGRNVLDLALYLPGVVPTGSTTGGSGAGAGTFSIAGGRQDSVTYLLDGGVNNNLLSNGVVYNPNPDTVAEFRILTSNYSAEFGRNGGGVVSVVTKSGTNTLHGSLFDYVRNNDFNANAFFNNSSGLQRDVLKRNQFGGTLGGPVVLPKVINGTDKLFFFFSYQGQRQRAQQTTAKTTVFTPAELNGDFSQTNGGAPDPDVVSFLTANPYYQSNPSLAAKGIIDATRIGPVASNYVKAGLIASSPSGTLISQGGAISDNDEYTGKADYQLTAADRFSLTLGYRKSNALDPFIASNVNGFPNITTGSQSFGNLTYTKTFSPTLLNEFHFTAQRNNNYQRVPGRTLATASALGVGTTPDNPTGPPILEFDSGMIAGFSPNGPTSLIDNTYTWSNNLTRMKGHHTLKSGFWYTPYQNNTVYDFYVNGDFYFYGQSGSSFLGNDRAAFLMDLPDEYLQFGQAPSNIRTHNIGLFAQDEWRVNKRLSLNYGVRYEYSSPKIDTQGRSFSLKYGQQSIVFPNAPAGLLFPGDPGAPRGSNFAIKNNWAPRFGFALDPTGSGKTSIRGGFGVFFDILKGEDNLQFNGQAPFFGYSDLYFDPSMLTGGQPSNLMTAPYTAAGQPNSFPSKPPSKNLDFDAAGFLPAGGGGVYYVNPKLRTPYVYQFNFSIQRELMKNTVLDLSYIGSSSHKLTGLYDSNPFILGTTTRLYNAQPGLPSYAFSYLDTFDNVGRAHYNSLALGLTRRTSEIKNVGSLFYQFSYTYGKSIDNESGFRARNAAVPYYNHEQFRAASDWDLTHYVSVNAAWELPFAQWFSKAPKRLTRGWTLYPVASYRSGLPLDVGGGQSRSRTRTGPSGAGDGQLVRANLSGTVAYYDPHNVQSVNGNTGNYYFSPGAFTYKEFANLTPVTDPSQRTYGTLGRNALRGPSRANTNLTIAKITPLWGEAAKAEIRADFFNLLNSAQFANPSTSITSTQFGQISSTGDPRIIQLALRVTF